jgi:ribosomal RNA-processing protein 12
LYGSASEESEDEQVERAVANKKGQQKTRKGKDSGAFIREDEDAPMDLLDRSIAGRVTGQNPDATKRRRPGQDAADFKTDKESGRMIIDEDGPEDAPTTNDVLAGSAYQTAITSVDGMSRDARGRLKLNKANKRSRALEAENDVDMLEGIMDDDKDRKKKAKRTSEKLGSEFRSKVSQVKRIFPFVCLFYQSNPFLHEF